MNHIYGLLTDVAGFPVGSDDGEPQQRLRSRGALHSPGSSLLGYKCGQWLLPYVLGTVRNRNIHLFFLKQLY